MTTQPSGPMVPGVAAAAAGGALGDDRLTSADDESRATDEGVPVGEADREADMERSGADTDDGGLPGGLADPVMPDVPDSEGSADGVPVGDADVEADRRRTGADDTGG
jgi:hypothetical protein